jgi:hypothetical protein
MSANHHSRAHLALPMRTNGYRQAHLALPMKTNSHRQAYVAQPMSANSCRQPRGALTQKCKGAVVAGAEKMGLLLPILPQASARK